jgi:thiol:disulfide interchange protein
MKRILLLSVLILPTLLKSQDTLNLYNPQANAKQDLAAAIQTAKEQHKHVLVQVGGNWCSWCHRLHNFFESETRIDSVLKADYIVVRINYSPENKNPDVLASLGYPQRFGFPVLLVLDANGNRLHTQDTGYLELNKGYDAEKTERFLLNWNVAALDMNSYK